MSNNNNQGSLFFVGLFIAVGLALGGYFIGNMMYNSKVALNTAEAKGLAEKRVKADRANWSISFDVAGTLKADVPNLYQKAEQQQETIIQMLKENGFNDDEIKPGVISYSQQEYRDYSQKVVDQKHVLTGTISIETGQVDLVSKVRANINKLIAQGIDIENRAPSYHFTKLNDIKPEMLKEATKNARLAANEFAENAGVEVGGIQTARQGSFYVVDAGEEYGDTQKIEKDVRVVTTITFYLTD